ncbi:MAG: hypothetical protein CVT96_03735 [Bacteroidetes bacterium HGW-Bacteroidetes-13]|nr:MAG: hypothetical protein CVT96_03735 [Bacteroidetes bacterium HGW-Bacteroidetes-13]
MEEKILKYDKLVIFLVWVGIFLPHLAVLPVNIMEARNFITAREMLQDGNWLLTTMNGLPRYEKPPLPTWLTAFSAAIFGLKNIAALRFPSALMALLLIFFTRELSLHLGQSKRFALHVSLIVATSFYVIYAGRDGSWDVYAHAFMMGGIFYLYKFLSANDKLYRNALFSGIFIGLSFMSKGPVSHFALLLPFLMAYGVVFRFQSLKKKLFPLFLLLISALILSAWWPLYVYLFDRSAAETIAEIEGNAWVSNSVKSVFYYWSFFTQSGIWTIPAFVSLLYPYLKPKVSNPKVYRFMFLWTIFAVLLLSLIPEKKARYLFPVLIPLAVNLAFYIEYLFNEFKNLKRIEKLPIYLHFGILILVGLAFPIAVFKLFYRNLAFLKYWYFGASLLMVLLAVWMLFLLFKNNIPKLFYTNILLLLIVVLVAFPLGRLFYDNPDNIATRKITVAEHTFQTTTYSYGEISPEILWQYDLHKLPQVDRLKNVPDFQKATFLVNENHEEAFLSNFDSDFTIKFLMTIDVNPFAANKKNHKGRLTAKLFLIEKK